MKTFSISKWLSLASLILGIYCFWPNYHLYYSCGYYQKSIDTILKKEFSELCGCIFLFPLLFILWVGSLIRKKHRRWLTIVFGAFLILLWLNHALPNPHDKILYGLRDGMLKNYSPDEIRSFARDFDKLPKIPGNDVTEDMKLYWNRRGEIDLSKTGLKEKYKFLANCECVVEWTNIVCVEYGGFENHWGFTVAIDGKRIEPSHLNSNSRIIRASNDIYFFSDY